MGNKGDFRESSFTQIFNPTNTSPPFFQVFDPSFLSILGTSPSIRVIASHPEFAFAHEAPIWLPDADEVTFVSNDGGPLGMSDINHNNQVNTISLKDVEAAIQASGSEISPLNVSFTKVSLSKVGRETSWRANPGFVSQLDLPDSIQMTNGGTGPFNGQLVLVNSGRGELPPSVALVNPKPPHNVTVLLDNFFGRQFNSLNDVKIYPGSNLLFFTDTV